jgi:hypothetical protein
VEEFSVEGFPNAQSLAEQLKQEGFLIVKIYLQLDASLNLQERLNDLELSDAQRLQAAIELLRAKDLQISNLKTTLNKERSDRAWEWDQSQPHRMGL